VAQALIRFVNLKEIPSLAILDMMVLDEENNCLGTIYHALENTAKSAGAEALVTMMGRSWNKYYKLPQMGFIKSPFEFSLIIKKLNSGIDDAFLFDESQWHLMWIDSDDL
jgi:hypothetical protein